MVRLNSRHDVTVVGFFVLSVQAIFPTPDPAALKDRRMENLVAYARKVEGVGMELHNYLVFKKIAFIISSSKEKYSG